MKKLIFSVLVVFAAINAGAQTKGDITGGAPITWLGLDFSNVKFIGSAAQFKDAGEISNYDLREKYFPAWNNLFIKEQEKFNVARAVERNSVDYAIEVTDVANHNSKGPYFVDEPDSYQLLTTEKIASQIGKYNFKGRRGLGLLFIVEGMSKSKEEASIWVTFVNMGDKKVLLTKRVTGACGGIGFRNYWAKSFYNVLLDMGRNLGRWK